MGGIFARFESIWRAPDYPASLAKHYTRNWSEPIEVIRWSSGPIHELPEDFHVLVMPHPSGALAYATQCMSDPRDKERLELFILAERKQFVDIGVVELLVWTAHFHRNAARLGPCHTVNFGRPWSGGSQCDYGYVSVPHMDGPKVEWLQHPRVRFLWLIPVTQGEVEFKMHQGARALEQRFEAAKFDYLNPRRPSVV